MSRPPSLNAPDAAAGTIYLEPRFCPREMPQVRGDVQQDIIDVLKPVDNDKLEEGMPDTEFNRKYPPDDWCEEAAPNARVWKICRDEATASDRDMLESWNKTLDVLLIFAGLFSAVSTAFIIESYKTLQPDYSQYVASFLYSAAVAYNRSGTALPPLDAIRSPDGTFQSTSIERWINGLWFISLAVSLFVALLSILVKQWLDEYRACVSRSAPDHAYWARRHALYSQGLRSWGVPVVISCLPLLLHVSLFLFLVGLVLFLRLLDEVIAGVLLALVALILGLYLLSMALPAYYLACPSKTPLLTQSLRAWSSFLASLRQLVSILSNPRLEEKFERWMRALAGRETQVINAGEYTLTASAVAGLVSRTDDPEVMAVVAEATSELPPPSMILLMHDQSESFARVLQSVYSGAWITRRLYTSGFARASYARCHRSRLALLNVSPEPWYPSGGYLLGAPYLGPSLGIEGALLCTLYEWEPDFSQKCGIRNLVAALREVDWIPAAQHPGAGPEYYVPPRARLHFSMCLLFLRTSARIAELAVAQEGRTVGERPLDYSPHFYSLVILVFCAAQFSAQRGLVQQQREIAKCLVTIVDASRTPAADTAVSASESSQRLKSDPHRTIFRGIEALYTILADADKYNIHPDVADLVAPYVAALASHVDSSWAHDLGLSGLILSEGFARYTPSTGDVANYAIAMANAAPGDAACSPQRLHDFFRCFSVLEARAAGLQFATYQYSILSDLVRMVFPHLRRPQNERAVLCYFLEDATVLERWMEIFWNGCPEDALLDRTLLARALAAALRRRARTGRNTDADAAWAHALFTSQSVTRTAESALALHAKGPDPETRGALSSFLTHWKHFSPSSWLRLCDNLKAVHGETSLALEEDIEWFRNGLLSGGIDGDCDVECECMLPYEPDPELVDRTEDAVPLAGGGWSGRFQLWLPWTRPAYRNGLGSGVRDGLSLEYEEVAVGSR